MARSQQNCQEKTDRYHSKNRSGLLTQEKTKTASVGSQECCSRIARRTRKGATGILLIIAYGL
jgi:hypothetical protein